MHGENDDGSPAAGGMQVLGTGDGDISAAGDAWQDGEFRHQPSLVAPVGAHDRGRVEVGANAGGVFLHATAAAG